MKSLGIVRKIDELGRLVLPIETRRAMGLSAGEGVEIFVDADRVLTNVPKEEFPAQTLAIELYREAGIRGCEIGYILADRDPVTR